MKQIRFAVVGIGHMGKRWAKTIAQHPGASFEAAVEPKLIGARTLESVLADPDIDAVLIATPHNELAPITKRALKAGKHVLCEKPGAIGADEIDENIKLALQNNLIYGVGYNYHYFDGYLRARKLVESGKIGDVLFIRAAHGFGGRPGYEKEWRLNKKIGGGGHLHDQGVHLINMAITIMGAPDSVVGLRADSYWKAGTEDNGFVLMKKGNVIASIHSSLTQWKRKHTFEIYGTKGYVIIEGLGRRYGDGERLIVGKRTNNPDAVKEKVIKCNPDADKTLRLELEEFIKSVAIKRNNGSLSPINAYLTLRILEEVYRKDKI